MPSVLQKTDASNYNSNALSDAFTPPVPPLPPGYLNTPLGSPIADTYSSPTSTTPLPTPSASKPLPPIRRSSSISRDDTDVDERSMVFVEKLPVTPTPESRKAAENLTVKRRSMSVSDVELQKIMSASTAAYPGLPRTPEVSRRQEQEPVGPEDTTLNGILNDFKGELSQLDPSSTSHLQLRDPSTPSRRAAYQRSKTDSLVLSSGQGPERTSTSSTMPTLTLSRTDVENATTEPSPSPIVPPRSTSLNSTPARSNSGTSSKLRPVRSRSGNSFALPPPSSSRNLRVLHRPTASTSEPSLIPTDDSRLCELY